MVYVAALEALLGLAKMMIYLSHVAQITNNNSMQVTTMQEDKALIKTLPKYANSADIFLFDLAMELVENTSMNNCTIKLKNDK